MAHSGFIDIDGHSTQRMVFISVCYGLSGTVMTGNFVTLPGNGNGGDSVPLVLLMLFYAACSIGAGLLSWRHPRPIKIVCSLAFVLLCSLSLTLKAFDSDLYLVESVLIGTGLGAGTIVWSYLFSTLERRQVVMGNMISSAAWGVGNVLMASIDGKPAYLMSMGAVLLVCLFSLFCFRKTILYGDTEETAHSQPVEPDKETTLYMTKKMLKLLWEPFLLVCVFGFASGLIRATINSPGSDSALYSLLRSACSVIGAALFLAWARKNKTLEMSTMILGLLIIPASVFMLLPIVEPSYDFLLVFIIDIAYLFAWMVVTVSVYMSVNSNRGSSMLAYGLANGLRHIAVSCGYVLSFVLAAENISGRNGDGLWPLALAALYSVAILAVWMDISKGYEKDKARQSVRVLLSVPEERIRNNTELINRYCLTEREMDILILTLSGRNARGIGQVLFITENTVKTHLKSIYAKLGVHSKEELHTMVDKAVGFLDND